MPNVYIYKLHKLIKSSELIWKFDLVVFVMKMYSKADK